MECISLSKFNEDQDITTKVGLCKREPDAGAGGANSNPRKEVSLNTT